MATKFVKSYVIGILDGCDSDIIIGDVSKVKELKEKYANTNVEIITSFRFGEIQHLVYSHVNNRMDKYRERLTYFNGLTKTEVIAKCSKD